MCEHNWNVSEQDSSVGASSSVYGSGFSAETKAILKEELRKSRHRNAQRRYKSKLQQQRREMEEARDKAMLQCQNAKQEIAKKDAVIEDMKIAMTKQNEDLKVLRKQLNDLHKLEDWQRFSCQNSSTYQPYQEHAFTGPSTINSKTSSFSSRTSDVISHASSYGQDDDAALYEQSSCEPFSTMAPASANEIKCDMRFFSSEPFLFTDENLKEEDPFSENFDVAFSSLSHPNMLYFVIQIYSH